MNTSLKGLGLFLVFFCITFILYLPTVHSKFVFDFVDWYFNYQKEGWKGLFHSFNDPSLHHVYHLFFFTAIKVLGQNAFLWHVFFCMLHAFNGLMLFSFLHKLLSRTGTANFNLISFCSSFLFLISPYQTEVLVWGATIHYLLVVGIFFAVLNLTLDFAITGNLKNLFTLQLLFFGGIFTHEIIFVLPPITLVLLSLSPAGVASKYSRLYLIKVIVLPQFGLIAIYFLFNIIFRGSLITHYGAAVHLNFSITGLTTAIVKYLMKYLLFAQFLPQSQKDFLYVTGQKNSIPAFVGIFLLVFALSFRRFKASFVFCFFLIILLSLFPVLNLSAPTWILIQSDRLGYLASAFIYSFLVILLFDLLRMYAIIPISLFGAAAFYALSININNWANAANLMNSLEQEFPANPTKNYYLLNVPDNFNGAYMFRNLGKSCFAQTMYMKTGSDRNYQITDVQSYNLQSLNDSVIVTVVDSSTMHVELTSWGSWWWRSQQNFEDDHIEVHESADNHSYILKFKKREPNDIVLYQAGNKWRKVEGF